MLVCDPAMLIFATQESDFNAANGAFRRPLSDVKSSTKDIFLDSKLRLKIKYKLHFVKGYSETLGIDDDLIGWTC